MKKIFYVLMAVVMMALSSTPLHAALNDVINIQFVDSGYTGAGAIGNVNDYWNSSVKPSATTGFLTNTAGTSTGVKLAYTADGATILDDGLSGFYGTAQNQLMDGFIYSSDNTAHTLSYTGLAQNTKYTVYVLSQDLKTSPAGNGLKLNVSVTGGSSATTIASVGTTNSLISGLNYLTVTGTTNASGTLNLSYVGAGLAGPKGVINGIQLKEGPATPEPASLVLLGIGGLLGASRLRKKSAKTSVPAV